MSTDKSSKEPFETACEADGQEPAPTPLQEVLALFRADYLSKAKELGLDGLSLKELQARNDRILKEEDMDGALRAELTDRLKEWREGNRIFPEHSPARRDSARSTELRFAAHVRNLKEMDAAHVRNLEQMSDVAASLEDSFARSVDDRPASAAPLREEFFATPVRRLPGSGFDEVTGTTLVRRSGSSGGGYRPKGPYDR